MAKLQIKNLYVEADDKKILKGLTLTIQSNEIHAIMGQNGSGKSTLLKTIMGHPKYRITKGSITFDNKDILKLSTDKRARLGLFLAFQNPTEIPGLNLVTLLRYATKSSPLDFVDSLPPTLIDRDVNANLSGGEKKKSEIAQMSIIKPALALLDEIDSGLDIDALKKISAAIKTTTKKHNTGILLVTHYTRILKHLKPHYVHIMHDGKIIKSGKAALAHTLEKTGYTKFIKKSA